MRHITGHLRKMTATLSTPVAYQLVVGDQTMALNEALKKTIQVIYNGSIYCIRCNRKTKRSFQQGYCYPCMQRLNECGNCAIFPERCQVEQGTCPKDDWAHTQCHAPQIVYLANTSGLKVGVTRKSHVPTRWLDQGAVQAIPILQASNRYRAGLAEVVLKAFISDKTNWRTMLKNEVETLNLQLERDRLFAQADNIHSLLAESHDTLSLITDTKPVSISYPVIEYPQKITSLSLDKQSQIEGRLMGIKGQYLLLDTGVLNIRKFSGYEVSVCLL